MRPFQNAVCKDSTFELKDILKSQIHDRMAFFNDNKTKKAAQKSGSFNTPSKA
jgi:hypothetical protein